MSPRTTARGLQRGHSHRAPGRVGAGASTAARQQPLDGEHVVRERHTIGNTLGTTAGDVATMARGESDFVSHRFEFRFEETSAQASSRQQGHRRGVHHGPGLSTNRQHIAHQHDTHVAVSQQRMLLDEALRTIQGIGEQHGLERGVTASRQLTQLLQQPLEAFGISSQSVEKARIGHLADLEHAGQRGDHREPVADGVCQCAQQLVMHREPSFGADVGLPGCAH